MIGLLKRGLSSLSDTVMSTEILIKANTDSKHLEKALRIARDIEDKLSAYKENSYISRINRQAGKEGVSCPPEVVEVIREALSIARETEGLFDPTVGAIVHGLFGFGTGRERIPSEGEIERVRELVDYRRVKVEGNVVFLERKGMRLDLGGIAKGWTAQKLAEFLIGKGADKVLVSIGGEICCCGREWKIAIKGREGRGYLGILYTPEDKTTISTSGNYERFIGDTDHHHIINPPKGRPERIYSSLTLVERGFKGARADALTTACFNIYPSAIRRFTKSYIMILKDSGEVLIGEETFKSMRGFYLRGGI